MPMFIVSSYWSTDIIQIYPLFEIAPLAGVGLEVTPICLWLVFPAHG